VEEPVEFTLAPENQAFCYLTGVGGEFEGAGENVKILRKSGSWVLRVLAAGPAPCAPGDWSAIGCLPICGTDICQPVPESLDGRRFCVERCGAPDDCVEGMECVELGEDLKGCVPLSRN